MHTSRSARLLAAATLAALLTVVGVGPADAAKPTSPPGKPVHPPSKNCYPIVSPNCPVSITISLIVVAPGVVVTVTVFGLDAGTTVDIFVDSTKVGTGTVSINGTVSIDFTAPLQPGTYKVAAIGTDEGKQVTKTTPLRVSSTTAAALTAPIRPASAVVGLADHVTPAGIGQAAIAATAIAGGIVYGLRRRRSS